MDDERNREADELSLDAILAEFSGKRTAAEDETLFSPSPAKPRKSAEEGPAEPPVKEAPPEEKHAPREPAGGEASQKPSQPRPAVIPFPGTEEEKILEFPAPQKQGLVAEGIDQLRQKADEGIEELRQRADDFAGHMFEDALSGKDEALRRAEQLIPGVDEEEVPPAPVRERKPRKLRPPAPDLPAAELAKRYAKGLKGLRLRCVLVLLLILPAVWLTVVPNLPADLMAQLGMEGESIRCYVLAAVQALALLLGIDVVINSFVRLFRGRAGMDAIVALANLFTLADALTLPTLSQGQVTRAPFCVVGVLSLWCMMGGALLKRRGQRLACRTAAAASEPYLVTRDHGKWNGKDTYMKWSGAVEGFGSQIQAEDGAERVYHVTVPVLMAACTLFAVISSVGRGRSGDILWCLAAIFSAAGSLSATFCFGMPWRRLCQRLNKSGAALAGWQGALRETRGANLVLNDIDLFPVGSVQLNGIKVFGNFPIDKVVAVTATVIRDAGSGLEKIFYDLLRSQGTLYRNGSEFAAYEGGGASETIRGEQILVGSASFMTLMDVALPPGLKVKNAVFCAIDGELAGIFALNYHLPNTVPYAIDSLIRNRVTPVLATRDFNLIPSMLRQKCKLPAEKMEFPAVERRRELSDKEQEHSDVLTAVLCREGVGPFAEAVVGARRLRAAVRLSAGLACLGSAVGALLGFYLTFMAAYASLTAMNVMLFLLMWLVPTPLISNWVDKY